MEQKNDAGASVSAIAFDSWVSGDLLVHHLGQMVHQQIDPGISYTGQPGTNQVPNWSRAMTNKLPGYR